MRYLVLSVLLILCSYSAQANYSYSLTVTKQAIHLSVKSNSYTLSVSKEKPNKVTFYRNTRVLEIGEDLTVSTVNPKEAEPKAPKIQVGGKSVYKMRSFKGYDFIYRVMGKDKCHIFEILQNSSGPVPKSFVEAIKTFKEEPNK
jgi:hypothetical protein